MKNTEITTTQHNNTAIRIWDSPLDLDDPRTWIGHEDYQAIWQLPGGSYVLIDGFGVARPLTDWAATRDHIAAHGTQADLLCFLCEAQDYADALDLVAEENAWHAEIRQLTSAA